VSGWPGRVRRALRRHDREDAGSDRPSAPDEKLTAAALRRHDQALAEEEADERARFRRDVAPDASDWAGREVLGVDDSRLGTIEDVLADPEGAHAAWARVASAEPGGRPAMMPLVGARLEDDDVRAPYTGADLATAPLIEAGGDLSPEDAARLREHYGL
jgi:PRC-barrel domain